MPALPILDCANILNKCGIRHFELADQWTVVKPLYSRFFV